MKNIKLIFGALAILLSSSVFSVAINDQVTYSRNSDTNWFITSASGSLEVTGSSDEFGPGYTVELTYNLYALSRGAQSGVVQIFMPERMFANNFYSSLNSQGTNFGSFTLECQNFVDGRCMKVRATDVEPDFAGDMGMPKIIDIQHTGSITSVTDMVVSFDVDPTVPVIGARKILVNATSNNGIAFQVGLTAR